MYCCKKVAKHWSDSEWQGKDSTFGTVLTHLRVEEKTAEEEIVLYPEYLRRLFRMDQMGRPVPMGWELQSLAKTLANVRRVQYCSCI